MGVEIDGVKLEQDKSNPRVTKDTFEVNQAVVTQTRNEIPVGIGGQAVNRIPARADLTALVKSGITQKRIASQNRCLHLVDVPLEGGQVGKFHCSRACVSAGVAGEEFCPEHDRAAFRPNQTEPPKDQRTFNSASIELSDAEREIRNEKGELLGLMQEGRDVTKGRRVIPVEAAEPPEAAPRAAPRRAYVRRTAAPRVKNLDGVRLEFTLDELAGDAVIDLFVKKAVAALDALPATSVARMKAVVAIQEWLGQIGRANIVLPEEGK